MKKVVLITEAMLGGIRRHIFDVVKMLDKAEYEIYLIYSESRADKKFKEEIRDIEQYAKLICCNEMQREIGVHDIFAYKRIKEIIKSISPDIVHCHSSKAGIVGRLAARRCSVPTIIYTPHAYAFQSPDISFVKETIYTCAERMLARTCTDYTINVSKGEMDAALSKRIDRKHKLILIRNGISENLEFTKDEAKRRVGLSIEKKYVGFTGRCTRQKDPFSFLEVAKLVTEQCEDVDFVYVGDGELEEVMREWILENGLVSRVHMLGFRSDSSEVVSAFDVYLSTALYEGLPYSMMEAMCAGVPIVATDCIGNAELVVNGKNGYLFNGGDNYSASMLVLDCLRSSLGESKNARALFKEQFSIEQMIAKIHSLYSGSV